MSSLEHSQLWGPWNSPPWHHDTCKWKEDRSETVFRDGPDQTRGRMKSIQSICYNIVSSQWDAKPCARRRIWILGLQPSPHTELATRLNCFCSLIEKMGSQRCEDRNSWSLGSLPLHNWAHLSACRHLFSPGVCVFIFSFPIRIYSKEIYHVSHLYYRMNLNNCLIFLFYIHTLHLVKAWSPIKEF